MMIGDHHALKDITRGSVQSDGHTNPFGSMQDAQQYDDRLRLENQMEHPSLLPFPRSSPRTNSYSGDLQVSFRQHSEDSSDYLGLAKHYPMPPRQEWALRVGSWTELEMHNSGKKHSVQKISQKLLSQQPPYCSDGLFHLATMVANVGLDLQLAICQSCMASVCGSWASLSLLVGSPFASAIPTLLGARTGYYRLAAIEQQAFSLSGEVPGSL
jgi:hypothetical protein